MLIETGSRQALIDHTFLTAFVVNMSHIMYTQDCRIEDEGAETKAHAEK